MAEETKLYLKRFDSLLKGLWDLETLGVGASDFIDASVSVIDQFRATYLIEDSRYVVFWSWKRPKEQLNIPKNYGLCVARLKSTLKIFSDEFKEMCGAKFREQLVDGIIEQVTGTSNTVQHYLPFRPILKENEERIVYDASARMKAGQSFNDFLYVGPSLTRNLVGLLIGFRMKTIGLMADIVKGFPSSRA